MKNTYLDISVCAIYSSFFAQIVSTFLKLNAQQRIQLEF
jgi:hypothetical protein